MKPHILDPIDRFWSKVKKTSTCWEWTAGCFTGGYGSFTPRHGKRVYAHRYLYELLSFDPIPKGMLVCHRCDNRKCVRPSHLFLGSQKDNIQDAVSKNRMASGYRHGVHTKPETRTRGSKSGKAKLTEADVEQIRKMWPATSQQAIASRFGVSQFSISCIIRRKTWAHVI